MDAVLTNKSYTLAREDYNSAILQILTEVNKRTKVWRFHQILQNLDLEDPNDLRLWNEEPKLTLKNLVKNQIVKDVLGEKLTQFNSLLGLEVQ